MPLLSIFKALVLKLATPETAAWVSVPLNTPPGPAFVPIPTVTVDVFVATVAPKMSCTVTTGCVAQGVPAGPPPGWVVKASFAAVPAGATSRMPPFTPLK